MTEIAESYLDVWGREKKIDPATRAALARALGPPRKPAKVKLESGRCYEPELLAQGGRAEPLGHFRSVAGEIRRRLGELAEGVSRSREPRRQGVREKAGAARRLPRVGAAHRPRAARKRAEPRARARHADRALR